jgi:hypothetical protein
MIRAAVLTLLTLLTVGAMFSTQISTAQEGSEDEQTLWSLENAYFAHIAQGELEALERFYRADFIGWPSHSPEPVDRDAGRQALEELLAEIKVVSIQVRPQAVVIRGDVAVTHCFVDVHQQDSETDVSVNSHRVIHTWLREDGTWKILGGMSAQ